MSIMIIFDGEATLVSTPSLNGLPVLMTGKILWMRGCEPNPHAGRHAIYVDGQIQIAKNYEFTIHSWNGNIQGLLADVEIQEISKVPKVDFEPRMFVTRMNEYSPEPPVKSFE